MKEIMWYIQDKIFGEEQNLLVKALQNNNLEYTITNRNYPPAYKQFAIGSVEFVENKITPKIITIENYEYTNYSQHFQSRLLNSDYEVVPWWNLSRTIKEYPSVVNRFFIRPNSGRKIFTGTTVSRKWIDKEVEIVANLPSSNIQNNDLVIVAPEQEIISEYRLLLHKFKIIGDSRYSGETLSALDLGMIQYQIMKEICWYPDELWVLDICLTENGWKIVEINNGWTSGWYDMDYDYIVKYIKENVKSN